MGKLTGKTALITDTLQGIGEGIVRTSVRHDANLILLDISPEIEKLADGLCGRGHRCMVVVTDARDPASIAATIKHAKERGGHVDILVNNVSVCRLGSFPDMGDEDRDFYTDINIRGVQNVTEAVLPEMIAHKDGRIVMMSSVTGDMVADPGEMTYALTKAAVVGLTKSLAVEHVQSGIRTNAICSGYIHTPMAESITRQPNPKDPESVLTEMTKIVPIRHFTGPLEVGELAVFLASDGSNYLAGTRSVIDGGSTLLGTISVGI